MKKINKDELQFPCTLLVRDKSNGRMGLVYMSEYDWMVVGYNLYKEEGREWVQDNLDLSEYELYAPTYFENLLMCNIANEMEKHEQEAIRAYQIRQSKWWYKIGHAIAGWLVEHKYTRLAFLFDKDILPF